MNVDVVANRQFLDTKASQAARDWDELLVNQVNLSIASEVSALIGLEQWSRAESVIDVGCGNGYYLSELKTFFPAKKYLGIDMSSELIATATLRHPEIAFQVSDFQTAETERADVVVMRFLVQHLGSFRAVLRGASRMLRPGGALIIIEADLDRSIVRPIPPDFLRMLNTYGQVSADAGGLKSRLLRDVEGLIAETGEPWQLAGTRESATALVGPFAGSSLSTVFVKWVDLAERSSMFAFDFAAVRRELREWADQQASLVNLVTRIFVLEPTRAV